MWISQYLKTDKKPVIVLFFISGYVKVNFLLSFQTKTAVQALIKKHQTIPGSIWKALLDRFDKHCKTD